MLWLAGLCRRWGEAGGPETGKLRRLRSSCSAFSTSVPASPVSIEGGSESGSDDGKSRDVTVSKSCTPAALRAEDAAGFRSRQVPERGSLGRRGGQAG